jgi:hypothetical protein
MAAVAALLAMTALLSPAASAHGGLHQSTALGFGPDGPVLETTYGVIRQDEDGDWAWICEEVSGIAGDGWTFSVGADGRMWFTGIGGANTSADRCAWDPLEGPAAERFFTSIVPDPTRSGVVWATTGDGSEENPILRADDGGVDFVDHVVVDDQARLRSFGVAEDGRLWAQGMIDLEVWAWTSTDGEDWAGVALGEVDRGATLGDVGPDGSAWVVTRSAESEQLWRVPPDLSPVLVFETPERIEGVSAGPGADEVWLGGRGLALRGTVDGGESWVEPGDAPSVGCLERHDGQRWVCSDNWADGSALSKVAVGDEGGAWEEVLWFGDVHRVEACEADTTTAIECDPLWAELDPESGMDLDARDDRPGADTGGHDEPIGSGGCCASGGPNTMGVWLLPLLALGWGWRRGERAGHH